jgi:type II secretion system protein I
MSLLEVIFSIAILGVAMLAITNLLNIGYRSAMSARLRSDAALLCDSKMAEVAAGVLDLSSTSYQQIQGSPEWVYSVDVQSTDIAGLLSVLVTVTQADASIQRPVNISIMRFMPDPDYEPEEVTQ